MIRPFGSRRAIVMTAHTHICGFVVIKRLGWYPGSRGMTAIAVIRGLRMGGSFICGAMASTGRTVCGGDFRMVKREDYRQPGIIAIVMTLLALIGRRWMIAPFVRGIVATAGGAKNFRRQGMIKR